ncbi:MAG: NAD-dependent protein deacylase [Oligoflexia bacterium]|nr:NAD-dependent protein deacylase [Oligoflexia bacterium]
MTEKLLIVLTGAGISAESGLKTFRDHNGLWENHRVEDVASPEGFRRDPRLVQDFYNARRAQLLSPEVRPNAGHEALVRLEREWPGEFLLVTQNVDNLHERAGNQRLLHMHGELLKARCLRTHAVHEWTDPILPDTRCPCCRRSGTLRPHIVWFGEMPLEMPRVYGLLARCDVFLAIGTSGQVYPAAGFVEAVPETARTVELNLEASAVSSAFGEHLHGPAGRIVPAFVDQLLENLRQS